MDNTINITGNLTRDPELRFTRDGKPVCNLGVAINNRYQVNGEWQQKAVFMNVTVWGAMGENVAHSLVKGDRVHIDGRLDQRAYDTAGGDHKVATDIVAQDVSVSLKWATVAGVERNAKVSDAEPAPAGDLVAPDGSAPVYGDEEPF